MTMTTDEQIAQLEQALSDCRADRDAARAELEWLEHDTEDRIFFLMDCHQLHTYPSIRAAIRAAIDNPAMIYGAAPPSAEIDVEQVLDSVFTPLPGAEEMSELEQIVHQLAEVVEFHATVANCEERAALHAALARYRKAFPKQ